MISISEGTFNKLKEVSNASGLIECLLQEHFKLEQDKHMTLEQLEAEKKNKILIVEKEVQQIEEHRRLAEHQQQV